MKNIKMGIFAVLIVLAVLIGFQSNSFALSLTLSDGIISKTVVDGQPGDLNPLAGAVTFIGDIGNWYLNVTTGISYPALGTVDQPEMDLSSVNVTTPGSGTLHIELTETGFNHFGVGEFSLGGTSVGSSIEASAFFGSNPIGSQFDFGPGAFSGETSGLVSGSSPYSMTIAVDITQGAGGPTSFDAHLAVPEPGTLLFLGAGLLGLGFAIRRRKN